MAITRYKKWFVAWYFRVHDNNGVYYYWSTADLGGSTEPVVVSESFNGIKIVGTYKGVQRIHGLVDFSFQVKDTTTDPFDLIGADVDVYLYTYSSNSRVYTPSLSNLQTFKATIKNSTRINSSLLHVFCEGSVCYLEIPIYSKKPITVWQNALADYSNWHFPLAFGSPYWSLLPVYDAATDKVWYLVKADSTDIDSSVTYDVERIHAPAEYGNGEWTNSNVLSNGDFAFTKNTKTIDGKTYSFILPDVVDVNGDGVADDTPSFPYNNKLLPVIAKHWRSDTQALTNPADVICYLMNMFMPGGSDCYWASISRSIASTVLESSNWGLEHHGVLWEYVPRKNIMSEALLQCHSTLTIDRSGYFSMVVLDEDATNYGYAYQPGWYSADFTFDESNIIENSFSSQHIHDSYTDYDGGYVAVPDPDGPQTILNKYLVGITVDSTGDSVSNNPSPEVLELPYVRDLTHAHKLGILYFQRKLGKIARIRFKTDLSYYQVRPDQKIHISGTRYGAESESVPYDAIVDSVTFNEDGTLTIEAVRYKHDLDTWGSLNVNPLGSFAEQKPSDASNFISVVAGGDVSVSSGTAPNEFSGGIKLDWIEASAERLTARYLTGSTYTKLISLFDTTLSSGCISGGTITDNGDGTASVAAGTGVIRKTDSEQGELYFFDWSANSSVSLTDQAYNYIYVDYNAGSPSIGVTTDPSTLGNHCDAFIIGSAFRDGTTLHIIPSKQILSNFIHDLYYRLWEADGFVRVSGMVTTETGTRYLQVTAGVYYYAAQRQTTQAIDTSVTDTFVYYYRDGVGGWTKATGQQQIDNLYYDDGSGTLAALANNKYKNDWLYLDGDGDLFCVYGQIEHNTLASALNEEPPSSIPPLLSSVGMIIARITIKKGSTNIDNISTPWGEAFTATHVTDHGDLGGLADDDHTQYLLADGSRVATNDLYVNTNLMWHNGNCQASKSTSGYQKLASGLIVQWGHVDLSAAGYTSVTFPTTFPNACVGVYVCVDRTGLSGAGSSNYSSVMNVSTSGADIGHDYDAYWLAIGY